LLSCAAHGTMDGLILCLQGGQVTSWLLWSVPHEYICMYWTCARVRATVSLSRGSNGAEVEGSGKSRCDGTELSVICLKPSWHGNFLGSRCQCRFVVCVSTLTKARDSQSQVPPRPYHPRSSKIRRAPHPNPVAPLAW
jgi:hypothetical protein